MAAHPSIDRLEHLAQGILGEPEAAELRAHLASCEECRTRYEECEANQSFEAELREAVEPARVVDDEPPQPPLSLPGYEVIREIHRGGQGVVYQALQHGTKRTVAIKVMREGPLATRRDKARFDREVEVLSQLNHPNIVTIHESGKAGGCFHYVMDYIDGEPLDAWMADGPRSIEETLRLFAKICDAVNAAHLRGVIHRDLKPSNIRIDGNGEPHILDFGLAKVESDETQM
jgi:serine/threonine protein kinase